MSIPPYPTASSMVQEALRHVLTASPTPGQEADLLANGFQAVKSELWGITRTDRILEQTILLYRSSLFNQWILPNDFGTPQEVVYMRGQESTVYTIANATTQTVTLTASSGLTADAMRGKYLFIPGTSLGERVLEYSDSTFTITVTAGFPTVPTAGATCVLSMMERLLIPFDEPPQVTVLLSGLSGIPQYYRTEFATPDASVSFTLLETLPMSNLTYESIRLRYTPNITSLDEASFLLLRHMRLHRSLWLQGLIVQASRRYDEARYPTELSTWMMMKAQYASHNTTYSRIDGAR